MPHYSASSRAVLLLAFVTWYPACGLESLRNAPKRPRDERSFVSKTLRYEDVTWDPGNRSCWELPAAQAKGFNLERCCYVQENQTWRARQRIRRSWMRKRACGMMMAEFECDDCLTADTQFASGPRQRAGEREGVEYVLMGQIPCLSFHRCCGASALHAGNVVPAAQYAFRAAAWLMVCRGMTTIPPRLFDLKEVLLSLLRQSRRPDAIYLSVPYFYSRSWTPYEHPWWYKFMDPLVRLVRCEQDFRSNTGILCMLQYESAPDTRILVVDDDQLYHPFLLQRMLAISAEIPGAMIGGNCYHRPGIACWKHTKRGMCAVPNLVHTTYGILFQRRFFDAGIFNFDAAAQATGLRERLHGSVAMPPKAWQLGQSSELTLPEARHDNTVSQVTAVREIPDLVGYHHFHFDRQDPHSTAAALDTCTDALSVLWGPSLWPARAREVIAALVAALSTLVASVGWWQADHVYAFVCSGRSLPQWRFVSEPFDQAAFFPAPILTEARLERSHGQGDKLLVVDYYAPWCKNCQKMLRYMQKISQEEKFRHVEFVSVDFDASEELVKSRRVKLLPTMEIYRGQDLKQRWSGSNTKRFLQRLENEVDLPEGQLRA
ncbi:Thioredoxin (Trx) [Durusdinium trenchii]|uniref:Thioredoxin (Trx) n=1 Tax=Durusdinium trenchii TaxID=1381693 RepID=A0ABP0K3Z1_9DINO